MPTATITINISNFVPNGCCAIDRPAISPGGGGNRAYYKSSSPNTPDYDTIVVKSKGRSALDIAFVITPAGQYTANTIAFTQTNGSGDPAGTQNFTNPTASGAAITVTNVFAHVGLNANTPHWRYAIGITQISSGASGLIDPGIENSDEN